MTAPGSPTDDARRRAEGARWSLAKFQSSPEAEGRLLILIDHFSRNSDGTDRYLEGRIKLAKLDFLVRYPTYLLRILDLRGVRSRAVQELSWGPWREGPIDSRMVRYRYGPWDPAYYAILGSLIGRQLVVSERIPGKAYFGYRTTSRGAQAATLLINDGAFAPVVMAAKVLRRNLDLTGTKLKELVYELPEVADANWQEDLT